MQGTRSPEPFGSTVGCVHHDLSVWRCSLVLVPWLVTYTQGLHLSTAACPCRRKCVHVTNVSVNKAQAGYQPGQSAQAGGQASKWSFTALRAHLAEQGVPWETVWQQVSSWCTAAGGMHGMQAVTCCSM